MSPKDSAKHVGWCGTGGCGRMSWGLLQGIGRCREHFEQELERLGLTFEEVEARCRYPVG